MKPTQSRFLPVRSRLTSVIAATVAVLAPVAAHAATISGSTITYGAGGSADFGSFADTVLGWLQGSLGVGAALSAVAVGTGFSVAKNNPMPVLGGLALAAFIHWMPQIIATLMGATFV